MSINQSFLGEFEHEAESTRRLLERVPMDKWNWKPHEKSMSLGKLAFHVAEIPGWVSDTLDNDEFDFTKTPYVPKEEGTTDDLMKFYDECVKNAKTSIQNSTDENFMKTWTFRNGETIYFAMPKIQALRGFCFNHMYHHRGQLTVYLRLLNVPLPSIYGPSADEGNM